MVNYDLPWNPNRLEQRFGRIHRIGQTEVSHLWNIVANETREGDVFQKLFDRMEIEKQALGGRVFDVLGEAFDNVSLKDLLIEAIRYGEQPEVKARLDQVIEGALDTEHLKEIMRRNALAEQHMSMEDLYAVKDEMDMVEARKLQPYFMRAFFSEAFSSVGGEIRSRESGRFEIKHVPAIICERDRTIGETRTPVLKKYERICFEKNAIKSDRHIEVKGRAKGQSTITVSRNEIIYALNQADKFILAIVIVDGDCDSYDGPYYIKNPFTAEPDFSVASVNYDLRDLLSKAVAPEKTL